MTTGIFLRIAAEAAEEDARAGATTITPYWRVLRDDGSIIEKLPKQPARLKSEGFALSKNRVKDFEKQLIGL